MDNNVISIRDDDKLRFWGKTIDTWCAVAHEDSKSRGFHDTKRNIGEAVALIHSEASEALECWRTGTPITESWTGENGKPEGFPAELADLVIRVMDLCGEYNIKLGQHIAEKMLYNRTRPYKHGKIA